MTWDIRSAVEVRRRKDILWVAVNIEVLIARRIVRVVDDDIVVNQKVGVIEILVLTTNFNSGAVRELGTRATEARSTPDRTTPGALC